MLSGPVTARSYKRGLVLTLAFRIAHPKTLTTRDVLAAFEKAECEVGTLRTAQRIMVDFESIGLIQLMPTPHARPRHFDWGLTPAAIRWLGLDSDEVASSE